MKLLATMILGVLTVGLLLLTGFAQEAAPQAQDRLTPEAAAEALREQGAIGAAEESVAEATEEAAEDVLPREQGEGILPQEAGEVDPAAELNAQREAIIQEMGLPPQQDTGFLEDWYTWMPQPASRQADDHDVIFYFITWVAVFFSALIVILMTAFIIRYRARSDDEPDPVNVTTHSTTLEITWTVIPTCIVLIMFTLGFRGYLNDTIAPPNAYEIRVNGITWNWSFQYPNGAVTNDLHLPKDRPVKFILQSSDVIHSLYIPAFRVKKDVVPGRYNQFWVEPNEVGVFSVYCTEYCGTGHSEMVARAFVYEPDEYREILARISDIRTEFPSGTPRPPAEVGRALWQVRGCQGCHSIDNSVATGPTWRDLYGQQNHAMIDGSTVVVDENYIRESIYYPQRQIVNGYGNAMPSYLGQLTEEDVAAVIAFMKTISEHYEVDQADITGEGSVITDEESTSIGGGSEHGVGNPGGEPHRATDDDGDE